MLYIAHKHLASFFSSFVYDNGITDRFRMYWCTLDAIRGSNHHDLTIIFIVVTLAAFWFLLQPLKWELKQKPGISPPRGGFKPDDPNQQIVSEDIFDEYGGKKLFLLR